MAEVVSVALELSSDEVVLKPSAGLLADSGSCYLQLCKENVDENVLLYSTDVYLVYIRQSGKMSKRDFATLRIVCSFPEGTDYN